MQFQRLPALLVGALALTTVSASAQQSAAGGTLVQGLVSRCPTMATPILSRPEIAESLSARPIDTSVVCACVAEALNQDLKLKTSLQASQAELEALLRTSKFKSYLFARTTAAVFSCLASEFNASLELVNPE